VLTLDDWLAYIAGIHHTSIDLGLDRVHRVASRLGLMPFPHKVITVGGTNGKGSTIKAMESIYLAAGYQVAAYTSPHLVRFNERLAIQGKSASDDIFIQAFEQVELAREEISLSFFEYSTLAALLVCFALPLDVVLLEVGLGGRLDAVNIVDADITVISSISIDHVDWLGSTRELISQEKAGIFRAGKPVICGDSNPPDVMLDQARALKAPLYCINRDFHCIQKGKFWAWKNAEKTYSPLPLSPLKLENIACAMMAIECYQAALPVTQFAIISGIAKAALAGRFEVLESSPVVIVDVAHNPESAALLAERLIARNVKIKAVFAILESKDVLNTIEPLLSIVSDWYLSELDFGDSVKVDVLEAQFREFGIDNCYTTDTVSQALAKAIAGSDDQDEVVVFGSFHAVREAKHYLSIGMESI
jgi:dihydrofolate synthase/folylpolyglutamate synthase